VLSNDIRHYRFTRERFEEMRDRAWVIEQHSPQI
jgi:hypothetical protein